MTTLTDRPASPVLTPREVQTVAKARRILERWNLTGQPIDEALAHLRAMYGLRRRGLRDYVLDTMGPLGNLPVQRFRLYADAGGQEPIPVPPAATQPLADYLTETFDQRSLPGLIQLLQGREGDEREFYL